MNTKVKICGLTTEQEAEILNVNGADYAGLVLFYEKSKRYNTIWNARSILSRLDPQIKKVAVTVSPTREQVQMIQQMDFQILQIHGKLTGEVREVIHIPIWYAHHISKESELPGSSSDPLITGYLVDGAEPGSGKVFDWERLNAFDRGGKSMILAGGLNPDNVQQAIKILQPDIVDVSSGVENEHGKDEKKIKEFIRKVREYE